MSSGGSVPAFHDSVALHVPEFSRNPAEQIQPERVPRSIHDYVTFSVLSVEGKWYHKAAVVTIGVLLVILMGVSTNKVPMNSGLPVVFFGGVFCSCALLYTTVIEVRRMFIESLRDPSFEVPWLRRICLFVSMAASVFLLVAVIVFLIPSTAEDGSPVDRSAGMVNLAQAAIPVYGYVFLTFLLYRNGKDLRERLADRGNLMTLFNPPEAKICCGRC